MYHSLLKYHMQLHGYKQEFILSCYISLLAQRCLFNSQQFQAMSPLCLPMIHIHGATFGRQMNRNISILQPVTLYWCYEMPSFSPSCGTSVTIGHMHAHKLAFVITLSGDSISICIYINTLFIRSETYLQSGDTCTVHNQRPLFNPWDFSQPMCLQCYTDAVLLILQVTDIWHFDHVFLPLALYI